MKTFLKIKIFLLITLVFALWQNISFSAEITILNIHSHPRAGDNWIVSFETIGNSDLTISPDDKASIDDLDFISLKCGEEERTPQILKGDVIFYPDWFCNSETKINHLVNINRAHILKFQFGDKIEYAYNSPDTTLYDFSSGAGTDNMAYEKSGSQPTNPNDYDSEASLLQGDYNNVSSSNNIRWQTVQAVADEWDSHIYTFTINEFLSTITSLDLEWEGYGETSSGFDTYFYIWDKNSGSWELLNSQDFTSESDGLLTGKITTNISSYIDSGKLILMTTTQKPGTPLGQLCGGDGECSSGYCIDGVCCNSSCGGDCELCDLSGSEGSCTVRPANDNTEVITACYYCNGVSGTSVGYSGNEGIGCSGNCTHCISGSCDDWPNNEQHEGCTGFCMACQSGSCDFATAGTDPGNQCPTGSTSALGCATGNCNDSGSCSAYSSGDRSCPVCQKCTDSDVACENYAAYEEDTGCTDVCYGCNSGSCTYVPQDQKDIWGSNLCSDLHYACSGSQALCRQPVDYTCRAKPWGFLNCDNICGANSEWCSAACQSATCQSPCSDPCWSALVTACWCAEWRID